MVVSTPQVPTEIIAPPNQVAFALAEQPRVEIVVETVSKEVEVASTTLRRLVESENLDTRAEIKEAAQKLREGQEWDYTSCNCYSFVKSRIPTLPKMADVMPNSEPVIGGVVVFVYPSGIKHVAYIAHISPEGIEILEANFIKCMLGTRVVSWDDPNIVGYAQY